MMLENLTTKDTETKVVSRHMLDTRCDLAKAQMRHEIYACLGSKYFRDLVQIEVYKILQRYLILIGAIGLIFIVLVSLSNLAFEGERRDVLAPTNASSGCPRLANVTSPNECSLPDYWPWTTFDQPHREGMSG